MTHGRPSCLAPALRSPPASRSRPRA